MIAFSRIRPIGGFLSGKPTTVTKAAAMTAHFSSFYMYISHLRPGQGFAAQPMAGALVDFGSVAHVAAPWGLVRFEPLADS